MPKKGKIKNGNNKAKHTKLLNQKKNKVREEKLRNKKNIKALMIKSNLYKSMCPCGLGNTYQFCCAIAHNDIEKVKTAEQLMRSRYTAFVLGNIDYLMESHHSSTRPINEKEEILKWSKSVKWVGLEVLESKNGKELDDIGSVEFKANFIEFNEDMVIHENSKFIKENDIWVYVGAF